MDKETKNMTQEEFKEDAIKNPDKYIGEVLVDKYGNIHKIVGISEDGLATIPIVRKLVGG